MIKSIVIASDHAGFQLKQHIKTYLKNKNIEIIDLGCNDIQSVDYPDFAHQLCKYLQDNADETQYGILICGTGIGMSIAANRHAGIRAAVCNEGAQSAFYARAHNNANVLCLGERLIDVDQALSTLQMFIDTSFEQDRHIQRIAKIEI